MQWVQRESLDKFYDNLREYKISVLVAPTSYGKTAFSPMLLERSREDNLAYGLIHVVPFRALVREIFLEKFERARNKFTVGYQSMDTIGEGVDKSPFFLRELVATTLDSYAWNAFGIPVAEFDKIVNDVSLGHGYVAGMSIYTSANVFDEAHIFIGSSSEKAVFTMVQASIGFLSRMGVPTAIETATMPSVKLKLLKEVIDEKPLPLVYVCRSKDCGNSYQAKKYREVLGQYFYPTSDRDWYDFNAFDWRTHLVKEVEALKVAMNMCMSGSLLMIRNTIKDAIEAYKKLKEICPQTILLHGWIGAKDRESKIKAIKEVIEGKKSGAIIATQVMEVGVEAEAHALVTDIAPIENIVQRAGRLCRSKTAEACKEDGVDVYIVEDGVYEGVYDKELVEKTLDRLKQYLRNSSKSLDWRLLEDAKDWGNTPKYSFTNIMEEVYSYVHLPYQSSTVITALKSALSLDVPSLSMLKILETILKKELAKTTLIKLVPENDKDNFVTVELSRLLNLIAKLRKHKRKCIEGLNEGNLLFKVETADGMIDVSVELQQWMSPFEVLKRIYNNVMKKVSKRVSIRDFYVPLESECYDSELGAFYDVHM